MPALTVYCSDQAHSSIDKAVVTLGLGLDNLRRVRSDDEFKLDLAALEQAIADDRAAGRLPLAVVATAGTTSTTSVDPIEQIAAICKREDLWLHVDGAYAGVTGICPELRPALAGIEQADSYVTNPHKWLFVPVDCSLLFVRDPRSAQTSVLHRSGLSPDRTQRRYQPDGPGRSAWAGVSGR